MDISGGTSKLAKAALHLPQNCRYVDFKKDFAPFQDELLLLVEINVRQKLNPKSEIIGGEETIEANRVFVKILVALGSRRRVNAWTASDRRTPVQTFPVHIAYFLEIL